MNIHFSAGDIALIYSVIGIWVIGFVLLIINMILIGSFLSSHRFKATNTGILLLYAILGYGLFNGYWGLFSKSPGDLVIGLVLGIPLMPIVHSIYLFWMRQKIRNGKRTQKRNPTQSNSVGEPPKTIGPPSLAVGITADEKLAPFVRKVKDVSDV